ncbi:MAG TPA: VWA domain-containing protein [Acidimicrobiales bacterium]|nr:VWA domain-containing protein [Acidimicrobiales bacterium]
MTRRWDYRRWDGTQRGFEDDVDSLFSELADDLLYHGDPDAALRRLLTSGFRRPDGEQVQGLRELMERLRNRRQEELERGDLGGAFHEIAQELDDVVAEERAGLEALAQEARSSGDERRRQVTEEVVAERGVQLDLLPNDLAGKVRGLQHYDFVSSEAREHFEALMERLREEITKSWFDQMSEAMRNPDPAALERARQMLDALNRMIEQRAAGEELDPGFESFMEQFGDFFPGNPQTLDELLEQFAAQMAAVQAVLDSMSPEQRAQLQALADALFEDLDLRWQVDRLAENLRQAVPGAGWGRRYRFSGTDPMGLADAAASARRLGEMDQLEQFLRSATSPGALAEVDLDQVAKYLGDDGARSMEALARLARELEEAGLIEQREGRYELTALGIRRIGQRALSDLFARLAKDRIGGHTNTVMGTGHEPEGQTKPYEFGDPFTLDIKRTVHNAVSRTGIGTPVRLQPEDFEITRTEHMTRASTVLMVDLSLSMPMRDNFLAAKKVAIALHTLISSRFPRDFLGLVGFSEVAREIKAQDLPEVSWDFVYGTNMQHGLMLARKMLAHRSGTKQIIMITDGEPTAHLVPDGAGGYGVSFNYPPTAETVRVTLAEVVRCTRAGITINTFMLDANRSLQGFVEQMTKLNHGRAFFTTPETLGDYVLVDFLEHRRTVHSASRRGA